MTSAAEATVDGWRSRLVARGRAMVDRQALMRFLAALGPIGAALAIQFAAFAITARGLGVAAFGEYAAILGLATIGVELVGLGGADLLVRAVARDPGRFSAFFGNMLLLIALTLMPVVLLGLYVAIAHVQTDIAPAYVAMVLLAEVTIGRVSASVELAMVAHSQPARASWIRLSTALARLLLAIGYFSFSRSLTGWIEAVLAQSLLISAVYLLLVIRLYGRPKFRFQKGEMRSGLAFAINQSSRTMQGNLDRVILARFAEAAVVGAYAAGTRFLNIGMFPLQVMTRIWYPQFFKHGEQGISATRRFALRCLPAMLGIGIAAGMMVAVGGLLAPLLLGHDYADARRTTILLSLSLPLMALQYLAADTLTGAGFQHLRALIYGVAAGGFGMAMALGASLAGVNGLITAYLVAHLILMAALWVIAFTVPDRPPEVS